MGRTFPSIRQGVNSTADRWARSARALSRKHGIDMPIVSEICQILFEGKPAHIRNPHDARALGICGVHQEFMLVPWMNVAQNIFINREPRIWPGLPFIDHRKMHEDSKQLLASFNVNINTKQRSEERRVGKEC